MSPRKPGRLAGCPPWCIVDHGKPLDPVHRAVAGEIDRDPIHVMILVEDDPREPSPLVDITAWDLTADTSAGLKLPPAAASELAAVLALLGADDVGAALGAAVALLEGPKP